MTCFGEGVGFMMHVNDMFWGGGGVHADPCFGEGVGAGS